MQKEIKSITILGCTGSVGTQALDVAKKHGYTVDGITANKDYEKTAKTAREFSPRFCAMADKNAAEKLKALLSDTDITVFSGDEGIIKLIEETDSDAYVNSLLGVAGLSPSLAVLKKGKRLCLANKETIVAGGALASQYKEKYSAELLPVDSEHSAIFQCLQAGRHGEVKRLLLTASGGPFFGKTKDELKAVTLEDTLAHPTWNMGKKITVDSATLMNKGFEVIEASYLFNMPPERISVVVHRESIIHSMVEYIDNAVIAQLGSPDMRHPLEYSLTYPKRCDSVIKPLSLEDIGTLSFHRPDLNTFPLLSYAYEALKNGGTATAALNGANEIAVAAFLEKKIPYYGISEVVLSACEKTDILNITEENVFNSDKEARIRAREMLKKFEI